MSLCQAQSYLNCSSPPQSQAQQSMDCFSDVSIRGLCDSITALSCYCSSRVLCTICLLISVVPFIQSYSLCLSTTLRQPANSKELYTRIEGSRDYIEQLFMCNAGYEITSADNSTSTIFVLMKCHLGQWSPPNSVDCIPKVRCSGLWFERKHQGGSHCYLVTRAKNWQHSRRMCWAVDAEMVTIADEAEENWIRQHLTTPGSDLDAVLGTSFTYHLAFIWLGLSSFEDGVTWRWIDDGTTPNFTHFAHQQSEADMLQRFTYIDMNRNWMWYKSISDNPKVEANVFKICKKVTDDSVAQSLPKGESRIVLVREGDPVVLKVKGVKNALARYLLYEWGPMFLEENFYKISMSNYLKLINGIISGNEYGEAIQSLVNVSTVHQYTVTLYEGVGYPVNEIRCSSADIKKQKCGFEMYYNQGVQDMLFYMKVVDAAQSSKHTLGYRVRMPRIGIDEMLYVFAVESDGLTGWSMWMECWCDHSTMQTVTLRFRLCASDLDSHKFTQVCPASAKASRLESRRCTVDRCAGSVDFWSSWTSCSTPCGRGVQTRYRQCIGCTRHRIITQNRTCGGSSCRPGQEQSIDIMEWIKADPELAKELDYWQEETIDLHVSQGSCASFVMVTEQFCCLWIMCTMFTCILQQW